MSISASSMLGVDWAGWGLLNQGQLFLLRTMFGLPAQSLVVEIGPPQSHLSQHVNASARTCVDRVQVGYAPVQCRIAESSMLPSCTSHHRPHGLERRRAPGSRLVESLCLFILKRVLRSRETHPLCMIHMHSTQCCASDHLQ